MKIRFTVLGYHVIIEDDVVICSDPDVKILVTSYYYDGGDWKYPPMPECLIVAERVCNDYGGRFIEIEDINTSNPAQVY
jgi:hypothetical protein